jgi:hypothetical protein
MVHSTCRCGGFIFWLTIIQQTIRPDIVPCKSNRQYTWSKTFVTITTLPSIPEKLALAPGVVAPVLEGYQAHDRRQGRNASAH